ncbi:peptidylprolyl isomerase [Sedimentibacter sp. zth1]|uniref:peptidylprolyl isomerase n=1 Tax=Sedimentibacter sp. zth1 TaxID=2816908 RepID=UPI001A926E84|nr:peptidylprolyl isomerase [Sedimentibacter sp. zth1]QSX04938.1 peptidylprolyl isomerase [Sedimentibacter sp. zth1]
MIFKKTITILTIVSMLFVTTSCTKKEAESEVKVKVNDTVITVEQFDKAYNDYKAMYEEQYGENIWEQEMEEGKTFQQYLEDTVLETLILEVILVEEAEKEGIEVTQEEIDKELKTYKDVFGNEEKFSDFLKNKDITEDFLVETIKRELLITKFLNIKSAYINDIEPTDEQLLALFDKNKDSFTQIRASHILVETEEEAEQVKKRLDDGENFEELAKEVSICPSAEKGGDLDYFYFNEMAYEFSAVAFKMQLGEISNPVKSDYGYHIIKLTDKKDTFKSVDREQLVYQFKAKEYNDFLDKYIKKSKIEK